MLLLSLLTFIFFPNNSRLKIEGSNAKTSEF